MTKHNLMVNILPQWQGVVITGAPDGAQLDELAVNDWLSSHYRGYVVDKSRPQPGSGQWWLRKI